MSDTNFSTGLRWGDERSLPNPRAISEETIFVEGYVVSLKTSTFPDGTLGSLYVQVIGNKNSVARLLETSSVSVSRGLQHGTPLDFYVNMHARTTSELVGSIDDHDQGWFIMVILDHVFCHLGSKYLGRDDLLREKPNENKGGGVGKHLRLVHNQTDT